MTDIKNNQQNVVDNELLDEVRPLMGPPPEELPPQSIRPIEADEVVEAPLPDDSTTSEAVEEIVAEESSRLIEAEDEKLASAFTSKPPKKSIRSFLAAWWQNRRARGLTFVTFFIIIIVILGLPFTRYSLLNSLGVRVGASFTILDDVSDQPIKNVDISLGSATGKTDDSGKVKLNGLRQGKNKLLIKKRSFAEKSETVTLGWGSNPFTPYKLNPTGTQYIVQLNDWLSGLPVEKVQIIEGDSSAFSDKNGVATLKIDSSDLSELNIIIKAKNYRTETIKIPAGRKEPFSVKLVAELPSYFLSKRTGTYSLYKIDGDAKNEELLLAGTGKERDDITLSQSPDKKLLGLVTTRKGTLNSDGYALQGLAIFDTQTKKLTDVSESEQVRVIGWIGSSIVYIKVVAGTSGANPNRQKLIAYDTTNSNLQDLASSNNFNDVSIVNNKVYFAPGNIYGENPTASFQSISVDGSDKQTHLNVETWSFLRTSYDNFSLNVVGNKWYNYKIGDVKAVATATPSSTPRDRQYVDSPDGTHSAWVDYRDGKGVIVVWDKSSNEEKVLYSKGGLANPLDWLSNEHLAFRIATSQETANYIISLKGGDPQKITDVANINSFGGVGY